MTDPLVDHLEKIATEAEKESEARKGKKLHMLMYSPPEEDSEPVGIYTTVDKAKHAAQELFNQDNAAAGNPQVTLTWVFQTGAEEWYAEEDEYEWSILSSPIDGYYLYNPKTPHQPTWVPV